MSETWKNILLYLLIGLLVVGLLAPFFGKINTTEEIVFSEFLNKVDSGLVKEVKISGDVIKGKFKNGKEFKTRAINYPNLVQSLRQKNVIISVEPPSDSSWIANLLIQVILPLLFFALLWWLLMRQAQSANNTAISFGRSRARPYNLSQKVTFADVAGVDESREELKEIVEFLKDPKKFNDIGARIPKGVLLMGPPGTGKTLLARAIAGEADVPFFSLSGSEFVEMFVGVGASRVRDLFAQAKKNAPCIVFLDEIDAVGRQRGAGLGGGHDEREQTLNQLLVEMDGFEQKTNVIIIAATNRPDILDPALLRPGRFDRQIVLDKPDIKGRKAILEVHARGKKLADDIDLDILARRTPGFTGADLENLLNEAALLAARRNKKKITMAEAEEAIDRVVAGPSKKSKVISDREKDIVATHEVGHALLAKLLPKADPVHKISILPRGFALGYTLQLPLEDKYLISKEELLDQIVVMLGGRVAEEIVFGELTSGAHNDLEKVTELVRRMVCEYGMSSLGPRTFGKPSKQIFLGRDFIEHIDYGEKTADLIDKEINNIIMSCYEKAKRLLLKNKDKLLQISKDLREKETIEGEELDKYFENIEKEDNNSTEKKDNNNLEKKENNQGILFA